MLGNAARAATLLAVISAAAAFCGPGAGMLARQRQSQSAATCRMQAAEGAPVLRRHALGIAAAGLVAGFAGPAFAEEVSAGPEITDKVYITLKVAGRTKALENKKWEKIIARDKRAGNNDGEDDVFTLVFGLYGKDAPETTENFKALVTGTLSAPCLDQDDAIGDEESFTQNQRKSLTKRSIYRQCLAQQDVPVGLQYSTGYQIIKDKRIDMGRINKLFRQAPNTQDSNTLLHDRAGLLSTAKGGGQFEFTITPGANAELDKTQMVFGEVIEGLEWVEFLNEVPATQGQFLEGAFKFSGKVIGDERAGLNAKYRPLRKISVAECGLVEG
jgi:cyclophilin family peptidyl-prolyl cis-trans isomerase